MIDQSVYAALGVTAYVEQRIEMFRRDHGRPARLVVVGALEWGLLGYQVQDDLSVAGVPVVPDLTKPRCVEVT